MRNPAFKTEPLRGLTVKIGSGITPRGGSRVYQTNGVRFIRSQNVQANKLSLDETVFISEHQHSLMKGSAVKPNDVLLNITGASIGRACVVPEGIGESNVNQHVCIIRCNSKLLPEFLCQFLNSIGGQKQIFGFQAGGNREGLNYDQIGRFQISVPNLDDQVNIAKVLRKWDSAIELTEKLAGASQRYKRALMQRLLTGKLRLPQFVGRPWKQYLLSDVFERVTRKNIGGSTNVVTVSARRGFVRQDDFFKRLVASESLDNYLLVKKGEFCYNKSYSNGYDWGATKRLNEFDNAVVTTLYICFGLKDEDKNSGDFFEHFFEAGLLNRGLMRIAHEGGRAHGLLNVTPTDFFSLKITIPGCDEQVLIADILNVADRQVHLLERQLDALKRQKRGLMQKLLTGRLKIKA